MVRDNFDELEPRSALNATVTVESGCIWVTKAVGLFANRIRAHIVRGELRCPPYNREKQRKLS